MLRDFDFNSCFPCYCKWLHITDKLIWLGKSSHFQTHWQKFPTPGSTRSCSTNRNFRILCWLSAILVCRVHVGRKQKRPWVNCLQNMEMWPQSGMSMISFYKYHTIWPADKLTQIPFFPPHFISSPSGLGSPACSPRFIWQMNVTTVGVQIKICGKMCDSFQVMSKY